MAKFYVAKFRGDRAERHQLECLRRRLVIQTTNDLEAFLTKYTDFPRAQAIEDFMHTLARQAVDQAERFWKRRGRSK